jgi:hypothetical protein
MFFEQVVGLGEERLDEFDEFILFDAVVTVLNIDRGDVETRERRRA